MRVFVFLLFAFSALPGYLYGAVHQIECPAHIKTGSTWYIMYPQVCQMCKCGKQRKATCHSCDSVKAPPNCRLVTMKNLKYPDCCPKVVC